MSNTIRKVLLGILFFFLILSILLVILIPYNLVRSFPQTEGEIHISGLDGAVDIYRDSYGIPHIYADTNHDLFFAQGYVHAQDRFWQMDFWRHIGSGRLAELLGEGRVETDRILRTFGFARLAEEELQMFDDASLEILQSYADGVNAYLQDHKGGDLSLEYLILKLINPSYVPEPWQPLHSLTWGKVMALDLGGNMDAELSMAALLKTLTPEQVAEIVPPYPSEKPVIVPGFKVSRSDTSVIASEKGYAQYLASISPALDQLRADISRLDQVIGQRFTGIGSNSWAVSGQLTDTGLPYLANDTHLAAQMPAIWYEVGLHCRQKSDSCPYVVTGFSFAGVPGVVIGHNDRIAWGFTNLGPDVQDLYIERINPEDNHQYEVNGGWVDMELVNETIRVAGGDPVDMTVRYTRHGPIISDSTYLGEDFEQSAGLDLPEPYAIAVRWTGLEPSRIFQSIWGFNRAENWEQFRESARDFAVPAQNLLYADVEGNIGYQMPGNIPIRANGDGSLPVPGWNDDYEWTGYIPFEELPFSFNPPEGYIVTANNAVVDQDYPYLIFNFYSHGYRAQRIIDLIENAPGPIDLDYMQEMQGDNMDFNAQALVPILMEVPVGVDFEEFKQMFDGWEFQAHMDSGAAALFEAFWVNLLAATFHDDLPEGEWPSGGDRWFEVVADLVDQPDSPWWDIRSTSPVENRDHIFGMAFAAAVNQLRDALGEDASQWTWGDLHTLTLVNPTLGSSGIAPIEALFNRGAYRTSGGSGIVNATGWNASDGAPYLVKGLPSERMVIDLNDLENSETIYTTGQSGHAYHSNYVDMTDMWRNIQYHPMLWTGEQVENAAVAHLQLLP